MKKRICILGNLLTIVFALLLSACGSDSERANTKVSEHSASGVISTLGSSDMKGYGSITGVIRMSLLNHSSCSDGRAVYIFQGSTVIPNDMGAINANPVAVAPVELDPSAENYRYKITFLPAGGYTVAFTCQAKEDNPKTDDDISFLSTGNVTVLAGKEISKHLF
jgi:acetyltransferase-like isoleucine patch superfamily enzyme